MLAATNMLRPPPARIGKIGKNFALPRSVSLKSLLGGAGGVVVLSLFVLPFLPSFDGLVISVVGGAFLGVLAVTWSPMKGESLFKWATLQADRRRVNKVVINGKVVRAYIGLAPLHWSASGTTAMRPGAVEVHAGSYDDRGVQIPQTDRLKNLAPFPQS